MATYVQAAKKHCAQKNRECGARVFYITWIEVNVIAIFFYSRLLATTTKQRNKNKTVKQKLAMVFSNQIKKIELTCESLSIQRWNKFHQYATHILFHFECARRLIICTFAKMEKTYLRWMKCGIRCVVLQ